MHIPASSSLRSDRTQFESTHLLLCAVISEQKGRSKQLNSLPLCASNPAEGSPAELGTLSAQLLFKSVPSHLNKCPMTCGHPLKIKHLYKARTVRVLEKGYLLSVTRRKPPAIKQVWKSTTCSVVTVYSELAGCNFGTSNSPLGCICPTLRLQQKPICLYPKAEPALTFLLTCHIDRA